MRILVTNDDGVNALGIKILVNVAKKFGDVICIAPIEEQSGKSHCIIIKEPFEVFKYDDIEEGVKTYGIGSTPADCVRIAHYYLKEDFDLVLSGVNNGYNLGEDILYSGTIGAATEGILCGKKAIAFSTKRNHFEDLEKEVEKVIKLILEEKLLDLHDFWNVNICDNPKGIKYTYQGCTNFDAYYEDVDTNLVFSRGGPDLSKEMNRTGSDVCAIYHNYISISPLSADRTNYNILNKVQNK
jgi:5'-nucleotidase